MIIAVVSDTHRNSYAIKKLGTKLENIDILIHLGDNIEDIKEIQKYYQGKIINVKGNCDFKPSVEKDKVAVIADKRFFMTHGDCYGVKYNIFKLRFKALEENCNVVLYGHTHIAKIDFEEGIWYINPGSVSESREGPNSFAIIEIKNDDIEPRIISLEK